MKPAVAERSLPAAQPPIPPPRFHMLISTQGRRGERKVVIRMARKQEHGATVATGERVVTPGKNFVVGLGVTTVVSLNCFLCVMVARKAFLLPSFAVQDAEDGDRPEYSGAARSGGEAHHRTAPVFHAAAAHPTSTASDGRGSRETTAGSTLCSTAAMCERLEAYLGDTLDRDKDPCDDFYGYVCSRRRGRVEAPLPVEVGQKRRGRSTPAACLTFGDKERPPRKGIGPGPKFSRLGRHFSTGKLFSFVDSC